MIATDAQSLISDTTGLQRIDDRTALLVQIYLLQQIAGGSIANMTAQQLITSSNSLILIKSSWTAQLVIIYLLTQILANGAGGGGGSSGVISGNYGGGSPPAQSSSAPLVAIDSSNGNIWVYFNNTWQFTGVQA